MGDFWYDQMYPKIVTDYALARPSKSFGGVISGASDVKPHLPSQGKYCQRMSRERLSDPRRIHRGA